MINNRCAKYTLAIVAMTVFLVACAQREGRVAPLRRTMAAEIARFDPQLAADVGSGEVFRDLYEGLTSESSSGQIEPAAASGWNVSPDGLTYVFLLRPGLRWSNGDPVVAADFAAGLHRAVDPETASPAAELLECLVGARDIVARRSKVSDLGVRAIDDRTLEFKLIPLPTCRPCLRIPWHFRSIVPASKNMGRPSLPPERLFRMGRTFLPTRVPEAHCIWSGIRSTGTNAPYKYLLSISTSSAMPKWNSIVIEPARST